LTRLFPALLLAAATATPGPSSGGRDATDGVRAVVGAPRGGPVTASDLDARTKEVAALLRCPVCQGLSVADSPATMAMKMKAEVREMVAAGYDQDQVLAYFERSYGEFVRLKPPLRGVNWLVWFAPLMGLLVGGGVVAWALRGPKDGAQRTTTSAPLDVDALPEDPALVPYVLKVRELAYGWPAGVRPKAEPS
jgi:cytochrome c-type biogenesis protein CcmH